MKLRVAHKTEYLYSEPVASSLNTVRLHPRRTRRQRCLSCELSVHPLPAQRRDHIDFFGNDVTCFSVQELHRQLIIEARSEVETISEEHPTDVQSPPWDQMRNILTSRLDPDFLEARQYSLDSSQVAAGPELLEYARPSFRPGAPLVPCVLDLTHRIFDDFIFDSQATTIGTPVLEVLKTRRGVCQDFAHLEIGCLRSLGIPARYVSGYVLTRPPPGQTRLVGGDASHAWVAFYVPEQGWIDVDPTNGLTPNGEHITLAWARDYDDLMPVRGVVTGSQQHWLYYSVDVEKVETPP